MNELINGWKTHCYTRTIFGETLSVRNTWFLTVGGNEYFNISICYVTYEAKKGLTRFNPWPETYKLSRSLYMNHSFLQITEIDNDPRISSLSISQRGCILPQENPLRMYKLYSYSACIAECQTKAQLQLCGCVHHYTPKTEGSL